MNTYMPVSSGIMKLHCYQIEKSEQESVASLDMDNFLLPVYCFFNIAVLSKLWRVCLGPTSKCLKELCCKVDEG
jgi:hypothetical protein